MRAHAYLIIAQMWIIAGICRSEGRVWPIFMLIAGIIWSIVALRVDYQDSGSAKEKKDR